MEIDRLRAVLEIESRQFNTELLRADAGMNRATRSAGGFVAGVGKISPASVAAARSLTGLNSIVGLANKTLALVGAGVGIGALAAFGKEAIGTATKFQGYEASMKAILGTNEAVATQMKEMRKIAALPGLGLEESIKSFQRYASGGMAVAKANALIAGVGKANARSGGSVEDFNEVNRQLSQIIGSGKITEENLGVIKERSSALAGEIKKEFGTATAEGLKAAGVSVDSFVERITARLGTIQGVTDTAQNAFDNFGDTAKNAFNAIGQIALPAVVSGVNNASAVIAELTSKLEGFTASGYARMLGAEYTAAFANLQTSASTALQTVGDAFRAVGIEITAVDVAKVVRLWAIGLHDFSEQAKRFIAGDQFKAFAAGVAQTTAAVRDGFTVAGRALAPVAGFILTEWGKVSRWYQTNLPLIQRTVQTVLSTIGEWWRAHGSQIAGIVGSTWSLITGIIETALRVIGGGVKTGMQIITGDFAGAAGSISGIWSALWHGVLDVLKNSITGIGNTMMFLVSQVADMGGRLLTAGKNAMVQMAQGMLIGILDWQNIVVRQAWNMGSQAAQAVKDGAANVGKGPKIDLFSGMFDNKPKLPVDYIDAMRGITKEQQDSAWWNSFKIPELPKIEMPKIDTGSGGAGGVAGLSKAEVNKAKQHAEQLAQIRQQVGDRIYELSHDEYENRARLAKRAELQEIAAGVSRVLAETKFAAEIKAIRADRDKEYGEAARSAIDADIEQIKAKGALSSETLAYKIRVAELAVATSNGAEAARLELRALNESKQSYALLPPILQLVTQKREADAVALQRQFDAITATAEASKRAASASGWLATKQAEVTAATVAASGVVPTLQSTLAALTAEYVAHGGVLDMVAASQLSTTAAQIMANAETAKMKPITDRVNDALRDARARYEEASGTGNEYTAMLAKLGLTEDMVTGKFRSQIAEIQKLTDATAKLARQKRMVQEVGQTIRQVFRGAFEDALTGANNFFDSLTKGFQRAIVSIIAEKAAEELARSAEREISRVLNRGKKGANGEEGDGTSDAAGTMSSDAKAAFDLIGGLFGQSASSKNAPVSAQAASIARAIEAIKSPIPVMLVNAQALAEQLGDATGSQLAGLVNQIMPGERGGVPAGLPSMQGAGLPDFMSKSLLSFGVGQIFGSKAGGVVDGITSAVTSVASIFGGLFADGGRLKPGQWGIAGEAGPEIIRGGSGGMEVFSNRDSAEMFGGSGGGSSAPVYNETYNIGSQVFNQASDFAQMKERLRRLKQRKIRICR